MNRLKLQITEYCDQKCVHCRYSRLINNNSPSFRSMEEIKDEVLNFIKVNDSPPKIIVTGGEPLLHPHIFEIVKWLSNDSISSHVMLVSNGIDLASSIEKRNMLIDSQLDELVFTIDVDSESYQKVRKSDFQEKLLETFTWFIEKDPKLILTANIVLHKGNFRSAKEIVDLVDRLPISTARLILYSKEFDPNLSQEPLPRPDIIELEKLQEERVKGIKEGKILKFFMIIPYFVD